MTYFINVISLNLCKLCILELNIFTNTSMKGHVTICIVHYERVFSDS